MVSKEIRDKLPEWSVVFDNQSYDYSIIGTTFDGRVIYDYDLMIQEMVEETGCTVEDAIDWIDFNTIGALGNGGVKAPIVVQNLTNDNFIEN